MALMSSPWFKTPRVILLAQYTLVLMQKVSLQSIKSRWLSFFHLFQSFLTSYSVNKHAQGVDPLFAQDFTYHAILQNKRRIVRGVDRLEVLEYSTLNHCRVSGQISTRVCNRANRVVALPLWHFICTVSILFHKLVSPWSSFLIHSLPKRGAFPIPTLICLLSDWPIWRTLRA